METTINTTAEITVKEEKKQFKKAGTHTGLGALLYIAVLGVVGTIASIAALIPYFISHPLEQLMQLSSVELMNELMNSPIMGVGYIVSCLAALLAVFLLFCFSGTHKTLFKKEKSMTFLKFFSLLGVLYLFSTIGIEIYNIFERELNFFGLSTSVGLAMATDVSSNIPMLLYVSFLGPIVEELVFRGFLLRRLEKRGKVLAIVVTSLLFGLMHQNLPQVLNATLIGLVMGYIAMEYSIIWSIVLHIFNNFVMCELAGMLLGGPNDMARHLFDTGFTLVAVIVGIVVIIRNRNALVAWIRNHMWKKPQMTWVMTSFGMIFSLVWMIIGTIFTMMMG